MKSSPVSFVKLRRILLKKVDLVQKSPNRYSVIDTCVQWLVLTLGYMSANV